MIVAGLIAGTLGILGAAAVGLEIGYRQRLGNKLELSAGKWRIEEYELDHYRIVGDLEFINQTPRLDIMIPQVHAEVTLLSAGSLAGVRTESTIIPRYENADPREDNYWESYIVEPRKPAAIEVPIDITGSDLSEISAAWIQMHFYTYGRGGRIPRVKHIVVPLKFPSVESSKRWRPVQDADLLPIKTHLLTPLDNPAEIVQRYVSPHAQPGDIVTIGESPVAIMQGRFRHPSNIQPGWLAKRLCYSFYTTSSLATACGLQTLIDQVGAWRVFFAFLGSIPFKLLPRDLAKSMNVDGMFYRLAGYQANLIDDVTGTIPPYDKFIVMGPQNPRALCEQIKQETGLEAAVVDVNDLRRVKILASSSGVDEDFLATALITNPAGNGNEQTPVVLIRPTETAVAPLPETVAKTTV
ncbi:F420-0:Gamma-glutamyl ligase [filamentous cyanobacterium LEGE 11480]|uniref:F420-0:Gamma-glutamyl ligase n=1 Tax=Romeriopsis navalis LEGE 11480 TaxID=2777977 RepID=A0A928VTH9_9CYAN|nr:F420-0:Gamma-glutamyl ligase [Romeriopsis navalis]MBE9032290.1 F420-0:Gamma-glutamyl ligase [Romeriopsis navalis LEGE 11480]